MKWFYYLHKEGRAVAKVNTDAFELRMGMMGFRPCTYVEYLKQRKTIRVQEHTIDIQGKVNDEHKR